MAERPGAEEGASATAQQEPRAAPERERIVRRLDFSQPNKFTPELRKRIAGAVASCCGELAEALGDELNCEVALEVDEVEQLTWVAAKAQLPADAPAVALMPIPPGSHEQQMLLSIELPWLLQTIECLLGGQAEHAPAERHLSEIDWALARQLLDLVSVELAGAWSDLGGGELRRGEIDLEGDAGLTTPGPEPTLSVTIRSQIGGCPSSLSLLLPWGCVEPLAAGLRESDTPAALAGAGGEDLGRGVAGAQVLLRAEIGSLQMPIERMRAIVPGSLLSLEHRAEDGVRLFAEEVSLGRGRPGASGSRRAVKLESADEPPVRSQTYARLGRAELERARVAPDGEGEEQPVLRSMFVRVWGELGRTHMSLGRALELGSGSVVELDQPAHAPVELFANGLCFANGSLVVTPEGSWGVQVEKLL